LFASFWKKKPIFKQNTCSHLDPKKTLAQNLNPILENPFCQQSDFETKNPIQTKMLQQKNAVADAVMDGTGINSKGGIDLTVGSLISFLQQQRP
jgi:hypothetical protein